MESGGRSRRDSAVADQEAIIAAYFAGNRICVDAGAGTGKTRTLVVILAQRVLENLAANPNSNPFERILVITFTVEAARQLKRRLKEKLRDYFSQNSWTANGKVTESEFWRFLESESNIQTIDSFFQSLLREISPLSGIASSFDVPASLEQDAITQEILEKLRQESRFARNWERLDDAYPGGFSPDSSIQDANSLIVNIQQKLREFCRTTVDARQQLVQSVMTVLHCGKCPPFSGADLAEIAHSLAGPSASIVAPTGFDSSGYAKRVHEHNLQLANDFADLLAAFDMEYDFVTKETGKLTYIDIAYLVWKYSTDSVNIDWKKSLRGRYDDILVDEFQDTSLVQYNLIQKLLRDEPRNRLLLIGDVKQSIYQWRSADPSVFATMIDLSRRGQDIPGYGRMSYFPLVTNFRSRPQLLYFFNGIFSRLFNDAARGAIVQPLPYSTLRPPNQENDQAIRIHIISNNSDKVQDFIDCEIDDFKGVINGIMTSGNLEVRGENGTAQPAKPGDIAILFRRSKFMPRYVDALRQSGYKVAVLTDSSLFAEPEVSLVIDLLDWLANPDSRNPLIRILRSPLVSLSDQSLRYLASEGYLLNRSLISWPSSLPSSDKKRLEDLIALRSDLRWDREGRKADLVAKIIGHSSLDAVVLASDDGIQAQANLWSLMELVTSMEEESLTGYSEFVSTLKELRDRGLAGSEKDFPRARMATEKTKDSIKVMTVHAAKGLEFPILLIADSAVSVGTMAQMDRIIANSRQGLILKPRPPAGRSQISVRRSPTDSQLIPWVPSGEEEALMWISSRRDIASGLLLRNTPIDSGLREEVAEFWRLFYVAGTRAKDHIILSVSDRLPRQRWVCWMWFLKEVLGLGRLGAGTFPIAIGILPSGSSTQILVGIDDIPKIPSVTATPPIEVDWQSLSGSSPSVPIQVPVFVPRTLNPSTYSTLIECPRRYQYEVLWKDTGFRLDPAQTGSEPPRGLSPEAWGTFVHSLFAMRDLSLPYQSDTRVSQEIGRQRLNIASELRRACANLESIPIWTMLRQCSNAKGEILREKAFSQLLAVPGFPPVLVEGKFDLLFKSVNEDWYLVDYKSERKAMPGTYRERVHRAQVDAYAWALDRAFSIKVKKGLIVYVHPDAGVDEVSPEPISFEAKLKDTIQKLTLDRNRENGLIAIPSSGATGVCPSCPYSRKSGGPCEYGI